MASILVIEDEVVLARALCDALVYGGHTAEAVPDGEAGIAHFRQHTPELVLLDLRLPRMDGLDVLRVLRSENGDVPVIVMTAHGTIDTAVEAMKRGAREFLTKPLDLKALQIAVDRVLEHQRLVDNLEYFRRREQADSGVATILGPSEHIQTIKTRIRKIAHSPALAGKFPPSVLLTGETGTGKDLAARAIHYEGPRREAPFVHVNCTAIPDELFEAELFGHVKGAFTSAQGAKKGLMEVAGGGTIFFDEIGHMKPALQAKLLTAIEQKIIRPVGGTVERQVNIHIISATNRDLKQAIENGEFRDDLYHRLCVLPIAIAPLRERPEDIRPLAEHFVTHYAARFNLPVKGLSESARALLYEYDWPGNVRELSHVLESAVLMCDDPMIAPHHLQIHVHKRGAAVELSAPGGKAITINFDRGGAVLDDVEHQVLEAAIAYSGHNISRAARMLGITREAVRYRLEKHRARTAGVQ